MSSELSCVLLFYHHLNGNRDGDGDGEGEGEGEGRWGEINHSQRQGK